MNTDSMPENPRAEEDDAARLARIHEIFIIHVSRLNTRYGTVDEAYFEGVSGKLKADDGYAWFCYDEPLARGCFELNTALGFTATQIIEAIEVEVVRP